MKMEKTEYEIFLEKLIAAQEAAADAARELEKLRAEHKAGVRS
jgi:hypothetical protein